jgi:subtilisin family serine protease
MANTMNKLVLFFSLFFAISTLNAQSHFNFKETQAVSGDLPTAFAIPFNQSNLEGLISEGIPLKYTTRNWIYITCSANQIEALRSKGAISDFYFENSIPVALADSARALFNVNNVHNGIGGLDGAYTGDGVIIGYVDQGLDYNHPDFKNEDGSTRVLRYWDQTLNSGGPASSYGYGIVWNDQQINSGVCISTENSTAHGTTVTGMGSGNGRANNTNKGIAPKSSIIVVESNFGLPNWTMTIADACDYIFKVADTLGMPAVVNLSLGTYLGSHDGNDPASEAIEAMLDAKPGRIVVCAAGNSGAQGKYHVTGNVSADTSFVWLLNNPSGSAAFGANKIYFELWSDLTDATFDYSFGANLPAPNYSLRGTNEFRMAQDLLGTTIIDTIYNENNTPLARVEIFRNVIGSNFRMQVLFSQIDSTSYYYSFMTKGTGKYDMWSGAWMGFNNFVTTLPTVAQYPPIAFYHMPDTLQTIVSSWNCSEKVISVGNTRNRVGHMTKNLTYYTPADNTPVRKLSPNSSKGPNRHGVIKPDVSASGDISLSAAPLWLLSNASFNGSIDINGWHARNGGTSMASPLVAGLAALYLESCPKANYAQFKNDLINTSAGDVHTGPLPNNAYGYGKPNAYELILGTMFPANITGLNEKCAEPIPLTVNSLVTIDHVEWSNGAEGNPLLVETGGDYVAYAFDSRGCKTVTDTHEVIQLQVLPILPILQSGNVLATLSFSTYQWTLNGVDIPGATEQTLVIEAPYGTYTCYCVSQDGCISETPPFTVTAGLEELTSATNFIFPNPTNDLFYLKQANEDSILQLFDAAGKELELLKNAGNTYSIGHLPKGIYHLSIDQNDQKVWVKIARM